MINKELEFFAAIYDGFLSAKNNQEQKFMWKLNAITETMNFSNDQNDDGFCENALRMIMTLFRNYTIDDSEIDEVCLQDLKFDEKEVIIPILMEEFA